MGIAKDSGKRFQPGFFCSIGPGQNDGCTTVIDARRIARCYRAVCLEYGAQSAQSLNRSGFGVFIGVKCHHLPFDLHLDWYDLFGKMSCLDCGFRAGLTGHGKSILRGAADVIFGRHILGGDPHMASAKRTV